MRAAGHISAVLLSVATLLLAGCGKSFPDGMSEDEYNSRRYVNSFAKEVVDRYYLWNDDMRSEIDSWKVTDEPVQKVASIRYKDNEGNEVDKWTRLTDDYASFMGNLTGVTTTFGFDFSLFWADETKQSIIVVVTYTYAGSPAEKAGLKRGDTIVKIDGKAIVPDGYVDFIKSTIMYGTQCSLDLSDGRTVSMDAIEMYCDPVVLAKAFDCGSKKVGYIFYTSYTQNSRDSLKKAFTSLKEEGISELILDLRYNGGGYDITMRTLSSLIVPAAVVENEEILNIDIYNEYLTGVYGEGVKTHYDPECLEANIDAKKVYVIMTGNTASASEATICALEPYMDVVKIGQKSYGKYCGGYVFEGAAWYDAYKSVLTVTNWKNGTRYADNWGIYVMVSRYADKNGNTPCMPDGYAPDFEAVDNPKDGYQLGDPQETMLKVALTQAGYQFTGSSTCAIPSTRRMETKTPIAFERPACGVYLLR